MRANVLNDAALLKRAGQFAWLSIDSDNPTNAGFNAKFPTEGVPVFLVIDPATEKVVLSWYGSVTARQLGGLMDDGLRVIAGGGSGADALLARADEANAGKDFAKAADGFENALKLGGKDWARRPRAVESLVMAYAFGHNQRACLETVMREAPTMARDRSFVNAVYFGLDCATPGTPELRELENLAEEGVKIPGVLSDDTSQLYSSLAYLYRRDKDEAAAARVANAWVVYLRGQIAKANGPESRIALDLQLVSAANFLHAPELALLEVERAERDLPTDYNPPRLKAGLLSAMGRPDDALRACDRALALAYGAPKLRLYLLRGGILERKGDLAAAKQSYRDGIAFGSTLPESVAKPGMQALEQALAKP
jgi:tetratricopeptide (TPR) repeat protein